MLCHFQQIVRSLGIEIVLFVTTGVTDKTGFCNENVGLVLISLKLIMNCVLLCFCFVYGEAIGIEGASKLTTDNDMAKSANDQ